MFGPKTLDDAYVSKHAHPGEDWVQARKRLDSEVAQRYCQLPACPVCAAQANGVEHAAYLHGLGMCAAGLEAWPSAALSPLLFDAAQAQSAQHNKALAAIARGQVQGRLAHIKAQEYPVNALMAAHEAQGYLKACADLGLFEWAELVPMQQEVTAEEQRARSAFMAQYRERHPDALPWRL